MRAAADPDLDMATFWQPLPPSSGTVALSGCCPHRLLPVMSKGQTVGMCLTNIHARGDRTCTLIWHSTAQATQCQRDDSPVRATRW